MTVHTNPSLVNDHSTTIEVSLLLKLGCKLFPCRPDTKLPAFTGWQDMATDDPVTLSEWLARGYILGIYCAGSGFLGVDLDLKNDSQAWEWCRAWLSNAGFAGFDDPLQFSRSGSPHYAFRVPDDWKPAEHSGIRTFTISNFRALKPGEKNLEIFSIRNRGLLIAAGSVVDGKTYTLPAVPTVHPWLPALGEALGHRSRIEAPTHDSEAGLKNCTFAEVERAIDIIIPTREFDVEAKWSQAIWQIKRSLGVEGWPLVEKISYSDGQDLRLVKWNNERASVADPYGALTIIKAAARVLKATGRSDPIIAAAELRYNGAVVGQKMTGLLTGHLPPGPGMAPAPPGGTQAPPGGATQTQSVEPRRSLRDRRVKAASLSGKAVPDREWLVPNWIPIGQVTLMYGDGAVGKSLLALLLGVAVDRGTLWFGQPVKQGPVEFITAEDSDDELHRRLADISRETKQPLESLTSLHVSSFADEDAIMAALT